MKSIKTLTAIIAAAALGSAAQAATLVNVSGEFWSSNNSITNISKALTEIDSRSADTLFSVGRIDYPNGSQGSISNNTSLSSFLGTLGTIQSGTDFVNLNHSVMRFSGFLRIDQGDSFWSVGSDDGFRLEIDGEELATHGRRGFRRTIGNLNRGPGIYAFELVYFEATGKTGVEFAINNNVLDNLALNDVGQVPVPAAGLLMAGALAGIGFRRRKSSQ